METVPSQEFDSKTKRLSTDSTVTIGHPSGAACPPCGGQAPHPVEGTRLVLVAVPAPGHTPCDALAGKDPGSLASVANPEAVDSLKG